MLGMIEKELGGQPLDVVTVAADEILSVLKNDGFVNSKKREEIERVLGGIRDHVFDQFVLLGRVITDYGGGDDGELGDDPFDEDVGVSVEFEENKETDLDMVLDDEDDCDDDLADGNGSGAMHMGGGIFHDDDQGVVENDGMRTLNVQDIDSYWLQRKISQAYDQQQQQIDPQQSQKLAEEVFKILAEGGDDRQVETKLLVHLRFDKFSLVKYLLKNRMYIVWCIRLARTQDQDERKKVEEEMMQLGPDLAVILEQLHATRATAKERQTNLEKSIRQEAHRLKDDGDHGRRGTLDRDADIVWSKGQRQLLDLESLAFSQGDLLMANRKCELPSGSFRKHNKDYEVHVPALSYADDDISEADDDHELPTLESDTVDIYAEKMSHVKILEEKITREEKLQVNNVEETEELETEYHATAIVKRGTEVMKQERKSSKLPDCLLLMMCEPKLSMEVSKETWVSKREFVQEQVKVSVECNAALPCVAKSSCTFPASMAAMIEQKLMNAAAYEPFVLTRCKSAPIRTAGAIQLAPDGWFWKNEGLEKHRRGGFRIGAAELVAFQLSR